VACDEDNEWQPTIQMKPVRVGDQLSGLAAMSEDRQPSFPGE